MSTVWRRSLGAAAVVTALAGGGSAAAIGQSTAGRPLARASASQQCAGDARPHDSRNPLDLPTAPGSNPLRGAQFFVAGPTFGPAAGEIAKDLGVDPTRISPTESWAAFAHELSSGSVAQRIAGDHGLAVDVHELTKIASEPDPIRESKFAYGGTPAGTAAETNKIFCTVLKADPGAVPLINTDYVHPLLGATSSRSGMNALLPTFHAFIDNMAAATGNHPAVFFVEEDALGASERWYKGGTWDIYLGMLRYEIQKLAALPHTVVYVEGGYSDSNTPAYTAKALRTIGLGKIANFRGFYTDDTHFAWTLNEVKWAEQIVKLLHGGAYIVSTSQNGQGPIVPKSRVKDGNEVLCNPPGRGLGPRPTVAPGGPAVHADAYEWVVQPGNSGGTCNGGPSSGSFWPARAIALAEHANARLGPHEASQPY